MKAKAEATPRKKDKRAGSIFNYRLIRYAKPYKRLIVLMYVFILIYSAAHGVQALIVRELLEESMWLPPEPPLRTDIDLVVRDSLPESHHAAASATIQKMFADDVKQALTPKEYKAIREETLPAALQSLASGTPPAEVADTMLLPLGERKLTGAKRRLFHRIGQSTATALKGQVPADALATFETAIQRHFAPPESATVDKARIRALCLGLVGIAVIVAVVISLQVIVRSRVITGVFRDVRRDLCDHLMSLDIRFFTDKSSGEMISRQTNDVSVGTKALRSLLGDLSVQPFLALAYLGVAIYLSWQLLIVFMVLLLGLVIPISGLARRVRKHGLKGMERIADLTGSMSEIFQGVRVIKAFGVEKGKLDEFQDLNEQHIRRAYKIMLLKGRTKAIAEGFVNVCIAAVMFAASYLVTTGLWGVSLSPPDVMAFAACMLMLYRPIRVVAKAYPEFMETVAASERVFEILDHQAEVQEAPDAIDLPPIAESITFRNVSFRYEEPLVLDDVSFEVKRGEVVAIVGRSGAGKSTLLDLIPRFYDPNSGLIEIDGVDLRKVTLASLRSQIAIVSQDPFLFRTTIRNNIALARPEAGHDEVVAAARAANIHEFIEALPEGYDTICGERGIRLSGGQRQRITIARAIMKNAPILLLDEATSSLDAESQALVQDALHLLMEHRTTFVIAHRLSTVQRADKLAVLKAGRLVEMGTHAELIENQGEYWDLYHHEFASDVERP
jgi:ATP-binding cassette, subfamily B, bacterial MsbA